MKIIYVFILRIRSNEYVFAFRYVKKYMQDNFSINYLYLWAHAKYD